MDRRHRYTNEMARFNQWRIGEKNSTPLAYGVQRGDKTHAFTPC